MKIEEFAPAKLNLALHVTGRREDGYHLLDSLVAFADVGDQLAAEPAPAMRLTVGGPFGTGVPPGCDNLVLRAADMVADGVGVSFTLDKRLPPAAGIGGGSADAAAAIRAVLRLRHGPRAGAALQALDPAGLAVLGADVPACLFCAPVRMRGIGEDLSPAGTLPETHVLLANPGIELPTPEVFRVLRQRANPPLPARLPVWRSAADLARWLAGQRNDLEPPACEIAPDIGTVLEALAAQSGALIARMSGSGATCFALFANSEDTAAAAGRLRGAQARWWVASGRILPASPHV